MIISYIQIPPNIRVCMENVQLKKIYAAKVLGIIIDARLSFNQRVDAVFLGDGKIY